MAAKRRNWKAEVKGLLRAELKRRDMTYADLSEKLGTIGIKDNELNIKNKIGRGTFSAVFLVQCLEAIGAKSIRLGEE